MMNTVNVLEAARLPKPTLRGWLHAVVFFVSIPAGITLMAHSRSGSAHIAATIFAVSLTGLYGVSAAYHRGSWSGRAHSLMRNIDHAMIYVLIAGSYTPITIVTLRSAWSVTVLSLVWTGAMVGVTITLLRHDQLRKLGVSLYVVLGWIVVIALPQMVQNLTGTQMILLASGGGLYTVGAAMFGLHWPDPNPRVFGYHEMWHTMVVGAGACHYALVLSLVR